MASMTTNRTVIQEKFFTLGKRPPQQDMTDKELEAYRLGLKLGYGEGLKDGVDLGITVTEVLPISNCDIS